MEEGCSHPLISAALRSTYLSKDYPFQITERKIVSLSPRSSHKQAPLVTAKTPIRTVVRTLCAMVEGSFYVSFPLTIVLLALYGISWFWIIVLLVLGLRDEMTKRALGWESSVPAGLHFEKTEENIRIIENWDETKRTYKPSRWCWSGDTCTLFPFLFNSVEQLKKPIRTWLRVPTDETEGCTLRDEVVALDWFLPDDGEVRAIALVLHGLNGGSSEPYVRDFVKRANTQGLACVVMIARGMQQTPVRTDRFFNGARTCDAFATTQLLSSLDMPFHAVGFSMGGIILANMLARKGSQITGLRSAVSISGGVDLRVGADNKVIGRSRRVWQPFLVCGLVHNMARFTTKVEKMIGVSDFGAPTDVQDLDQQVVAPYNGYGSGPTGLLAYYHGMSAAASAAPCELLFRIKPKLLCIHSCTDPISPIDQYAEATKTPAENTVYLFPATGGHVGFPIGWAFWRYGWQWQSEAALSFFDAVDKARC